MNQRFCYIVVVLLFSVGWSPAAVAQYRAILINNTGEAADVTAGELHVTGSFGLPLDAATASAQETQRLILVDIEADTTSIDGKLPTLDTAHDMERLPIAMPSHLCPVNTTTTPLLADGEYVGEWTYMDGFGIFQISVTSDVASADPGVFIESSYDQVTAHIDEAYALDAGADKVWRTTPSRPWARVRFKNNAVTPQGTFELVTMLRPGVIHTSHTADAPISSQDDASLTKSILTVETDTLGWQNAQMTDTGHLKVSVQSMPASTVNPTYAEQVSLGLISGAIPFSMPAMISDYEINGRKATVYPFENKTIEISTPPEYSVECGDHLDLPVAEVTVYAASTSALDDAVGTGAQEIRVYYLDDTFTMHTVDVATDGQVPVQVATDVYRVLWMYVIATGSLGKPQGNIMLTDATSGADNACYFGTETGRQASFIGHFTVPAGKRLLISAWQGSASGFNNIGDSCRMTFAARQDWQQGASSTYVAIDGITLYNVATGMIFNPLYAVLAGTDVRFTAQCSQVGIRAMAGIQGMLVDEPTP